MKRKSRKMFFIGAGLLLVFVLWTMAVCFVDVRAIGPCGSSVGFASLNGYVHSLTGVNERLYIVTDWLGLVPFGVCLCFAVVGLVQWCMRKKLGKVDSDILVLGGFYGVVFAVYALFEVVVINYRPVLIEGVQEVSYPSSTTMLVMTVMLTALMQINHRINNALLRRGVSVAIILFTIFMVVGRLVSGVHWFSDIAGGIVLSAGLVVLYYAVSGLCTEPTACRG